LELCDLVKQLEDTCRLYLRHTFQSYLYPTKVDILLKTGYIRNTMLNMFEIV